MKSFIVVIVVLLIVASLYMWRFPLWFNYVVQDESNIENVIQKLGAPDKVVEKADFHKEITSDDKNRNGQKAYYWANGSSSYHYVVTDSDGEVINTSSQGW